MSRKCALTGKGPASGNRVSHSHRKTRRRFLPNLHVFSAHSDALGRPVKLRLSARTMRTITKVGGLDAFLLKTDDALLEPEAIRLKNQIRKASR